ncbi:M23 family metallopeptidase [Maricaulis sp. CAU 1757]
MIVSFALFALVQTTAPAEERDGIGDFLAARIEAEATPLNHPEAPAGCAGAFIEGGLLACNYGPDSRITLGEDRFIADEAGWILLGLRRQSPEEIRFRVERGGEILIDEVRNVEQRSYNLQQVDGVPQATVTPDPSTALRRQREYAQKQAAFSSVWDGRGFLDGFVAPAEGITTGIYGSARVYNNGHEGSPHWGLDWANDVGTPIHAPASGRVTLAEPDMYYEGGLVFIDHGQGLVSAFLHLSDVHVAEGEIVEQGQLIGAMGAGGRATGSHLDWRVKLRNSFYVDPALLLQLDPATLD